MPNHKRVHEGGYETSQPARDAVYAIVYAIEVQMACLLSHVSAVL